MRSRGFASGVPVLIALCFASSGAPAQEAAGIREGRVLYHEYGCSQCHGLEGQGGGPFGPRIAPSILPYAAFAELVRRPPGSMPAYAPDVLTDEKIRAIHAFLQSIPEPEIEEIPLPRPNPR